MKSNAQLLSVNERGQLALLDFNIAGISRGVDLQIPDAVLRDRVHYFPLRLAEQSVRFTIESSIKDDREGNSTIGRLRRAIAVHIVDSLKRRKPVPLLIRYVPEKRDYIGIIDQIPYEVSSSYAKKSYNFTMRVFGESDTVDYSKLLGATAPYVPTAGNITPADTWWKTSTLPSYATGGGGRVIVR